VHRTAPVLAVLLTAALGGGCSAVLSARASQPNAPRDVSEQIVIHNERLTLHLALPRTPPPGDRPLVLYASGDGGWFGAAVGMFHTIAGSGVPAVGFSSKEFMRIEQRWSRPLNVAHVVEGYQQIINAARTQLQVPPDTPVVLTGWSRGASLGVLVASSGDADPHVLGLVAIGLAADEQLDVEHDGDDDAAGSGEAPGAVSDAAPAGSIAIYPLLPRIAPRRVVVIQASGDSYLPAARARRLFGSDSTTRRLVTIAARNHRFGGGESTFAAALLEAVDWVSAKRD
jgi:hypothetical protein